MWLSGYMCEKKKEKMTRGFLFNEYINLKKHFKMTFFAGIEFILSTQVHFWILIV